MVSAVIPRRSILLAPLLLTACSKRRGARPLFAAESQPADYPTTQGLFALDRFLDETTNGEMRVRVYPGGQLGSEEASGDSRSRGARPQRAATGHSRLVLTGKSKFPEISFRGE